MSKENLDDYELPYIDFYMEIPQAPIDYLNDINPEITEAHEDPRDNAGLSDAQVSELRADSLDGADHHKASIVEPEDDGLFSDKNHS